MAATTTTNRTTAKFDDLFQEFRLDLEREGQDLEKSLFTTEMNDTEDRIDVHARSIRDQPQRRACRVLFGIDYSDYMDKEFLLEEIPDCLLSSSASFRTAFFGQLQPYQHALNPVVLEQLTVINYRLSIINFHKQLWDMYLKSGTGQIEIFDPSRQNEGSAVLHYWPSLISPFMRTKASIQITSTDELDQGRRAALVKRYLVQLDDRTKQYQVQFEAIKNEMPHYSEGLLHNIERFVRKQTLSTVKTYFETVIALIKHDYMDRLLQLRFREQKPNEKQIDLATRICQLTLAKYKADNEHFLFRMGANQNTIPTSIYLPELHIPNMITAIKDPSERARLIADYCQGIERAKSDLLNGMISASSAVKRASQKQFNDRLADIWKDQHRLPEPARLSTAMLRWIDQRQINIADCLQYMYEFKSQISLHVPPTSTTNM